MTSICQAVSNPVKKVPTAIASTTATAEASSQPELVRSRLAAPKDPMANPTTIQNDPTDRMGWRPAEPAPGLLEELAEHNKRLESATPIEVIKWAHERFAPSLTMGTAFGPEGMTIIHMLSQVAPKTPVFNLETGYQFPETLDMVRRIRERYGMEIELKRADMSVEEYEAANGGPVYKSNPNECCFQRKIVVLRRAVVGMDAWISAIRRDQSPDRAQASIVGWDKKFGLVKINPLANSTKQSVWKMITEEDVPYNPLHDQGYSSIGCQPCTRAVLFGEDERAGRWSGTAKTECGLHSIGD